jgi:predicted metalloprotease
MKFNRRARLDTSQIRDRRGRGGGGFGRGGGLGGGLGGGFGRGGGMGGGLGGGFGRGGMGRRGGIGGIGGIVLLLIAVFAGGGSLFSSGGSGTETLAPSSGGGGDLETSCRTGADIETNPECRFVAIENSVQGHWEQEFAEQGQQYRPATFNTFSGSVNTACGQASSAVGPFYCPGDDGVYLDLGFFRELQTKFGATGGDFAEAYIIAHEYGHHVQNLTGQNDRVQSREGPESDAVRLELQADCYAGVWAGSATQAGAGGEALITEISEQDIAEAIDAAERVGDDYIQERFGNGVNPESWTHGSSEQRRRWFEIGFASGDPRTCDTFSAATL